MQIINKQILNKIESTNINVDQSLIYLLALYFNLDTSIIPEDIIRGVNLLGIVERTFDQEQSKIRWVMPLFEGILESSEDAWSWLKVYRKKFKDIRGDAGGDIKGVESKMKKFFSENPDVRVDEALEAVDRYIFDLQQSGNNVKFLQQADYFISKKNGTETKSRLSMYIEIIREERKKNAIQGNNPRQTVIT